MDPPRTRSIIDGFEDDFEDIKSEFVKCAPSLKLEDFFTFWRRHEMHCFFRNRFDPRELLEMISAVNKYLVETLTSDNNDPPTRLSALYLLLCFSSLQPDGKRKKIRLTPSDTIGLTSLFAETKRVCSHEDATTAWNLLISLDAVIVVEERLGYGPQMLDHRRVFVRANEAEAELRTQHDSGRVDSSSLSRIDSILDELNQMGEEYNQLRDSLKLDEGNDATVGIESTGALRDHLAQAKSLLLQEITRLRGAERSSGSMHSNRR